MMNITKLDNPEVPLRWVQNKDTKDVIKYLGDVQRIALNPGDKIVLTLADRHVSDENAKYLREHLESVFVGHKVLVLGAGTKIGVLGPD